MDVRLLGRRWSVRKSSMDEAQGSEVPSGGRPRHSRRQLDDRGLAATKELSRWVSSLVVATTFSLAQISTASSHADGSPDIPHT